MTDAVTSQILIDGERNVVIKFTNLSDGTGESDVNKVDVSALSGAPAGVRIDKIQYDIAGLTVQLEWDASTDEIIGLFTGQNMMDFTKFGGIRNNAGAGKTGDILLTTVGHTANDSYTIILEMVKE